MSSVDPETGPPGTATRDDGVAVPVDGDLTMADFERRLRATAAGFAREPASQQDSASAGAIEALAMLQRELDSASDGAEDKCVLACAVLLEPEQEALLRAVGWDLLHALLPFAAAASSADAARRLLLRAAALCNPREMFSMVMEAFVFFQVAPAPQGKSERVVRLKARAPAGAHLGEAWRRVPLAVLTLKG